MLPKLLVLDVTLPKSSCDDAVENLGGAIRKLNTLQELHVRKSAGTYLSQPAPCAMLNALAESVSLCKQLHSTTLTFPLSADPSLAALSAALASAPALRTLRTPLPALWSTAYVEVAANPSVERVCLGGRRARRTVLWSARLRSSTGRPRSPLSRSSALRRTVDRSPASLNAAPVTPHFLRINARAPSLPPRSSSSRRVPMPGLLSSSAPGQTLPTRVRGVYGRGGRRLLGGADPT
ncbi:hypothetical protein K438DRAFT_642693 [Mycena galopus ATCC 62051]|nr:hypothetical protein K438DRAFT_642693 [Mycena galopus ATCC 62051]